MKISIIITCVIIGLLCIVLLYWLLKNEKFTTPDTTTTLKNIYQKPADFYRVSNTILTSTGFFSDEMDKLTLPDSVKDNFNEWIDKGFVTAVKDQMACGGCWAFSTCGTLTDRLTIATNGKWKPPYGLSDQILISCGDKMGMEYYQGCGGGIPHYAISALNNTGVPTDFPEDDTQSKYTWFQENSDPTSSCTPWPGETCPCNNVQAKFNNKVMPGQGFQYKASELYTTVGEAHDYTAHGENNELHSVDLWPTIPQSVIDKNVERMKKAIYYEGPITAGFLVYADFYQFKPTANNYYKYNQSSESKGGHAIVIVGWKKMSDGTPVWICKNSWGENWGYGFDNGLLWVDPTTGEKEGLYLGGFWNHIMGINDCFIESNATGAHPNILNPNISRFLPNNGQGIPTDWFNTLTLRDIYNMVAGNTSPPVPSPVPSPNPVPSPFNPSPPNPGQGQIWNGATHPNLKLVGISNNQLSESFINTFFSSPQVKFLIAAPSDKVINTMIKALPQGTDLTNLTNNSINNYAWALKSLSGVTGYIVIGIKSPGPAQTGIYYYLLGDVPEWNMFNIDSFIGKTTDINIFARQIFYQTQILDPSSHVVLATLN